MPCVIHTIHSHCCIPTTHPHNTLHVSSPPNNTHTPTQPGVDFTGWSNDLERCERPVGWGLRNQLTDMFTADWTAASRGVTPRYLIGRFYATQSRLAGAAAARDFAESRQVGTSMGGGSRKWKGGRGL